MPTIAPPQPLRLAADSARAVERARLGVVLVFFLTGAVSASWAARVPAVKQDLGLSDGALALAFVGLNAGAILGLPLGGTLVPRVGSRTALAIGFPLYALTLAALALASTLGLLTGGLLALAAANSVVDVAMNAHGVAIERHFNQPILSGLHARHTIGRMVGAGAGAGAAQLGVPVAPHFFGVAVAATIAGAAACRLLLPSGVDAVPAAPPAASARLGGLLGRLAGLTRWPHGTALLGGLAFCVILAGGSAVARVSAMGYFGSFVGPALIGSLAARLGLAAALVVTALLPVVAALGGGRLADDQTSGGTAVRWRPR